MENKNVLVAYYSMRNHTRMIAEKIKENIEAEIFEIEPEKAYGLFSSFLKSRKQIREGYKPPLKNKAGLSGYGIIFLGSPVWYGTYAPPVFTFISENDLKGKTIVPFCTEGGNAGEYFNDIQRLCPESNVAKGCDFKSADFKNAVEIDNKIKQWLSDVKNQI